MERDGYGILVLIIGIIFYDYYILARMLFGFSFLYLIENSWNKTLDRIKFFGIIWNNILENQKGDGNGNE